MHAAHEKGGIANGDGPGKRRQQRAAGNATAGEVRTRRGNGGRAAVYVVDSSNGFLPRGEIPDGARGNLRGGEPRVAESGDERGFHAHDAASGEDGPRIARESMDARDRRGVSSHRNGID